MYSLLLCVLIQPRALMRLLTHVGSPALWYVHSHVLAVT